MRKVGAYVFIGALAAVTIPSTPSAAFGLRLGPFNLGLPFLGLHHRPVDHGRRVAERPAATDGAGIYDKGTIGGGEPPQAATPGLLYPNLALPALYDGVFSPASSSAWPFGYDAIFRTAFETSSQPQEAQACQQVDRASATIERIGAETRPNARQKPLLQKLGQALAMASGYLAKACPPQVPAQPVARLQLMQAQIQALTMAIDIVRPPLQEFTQALDANQQARFGALRSGAAPAACAATPVNWSVDQISQTVQPTDAQHTALNALSQAFTAVATDLDAHCPKSLPATPLARLETIESRLDATWRATLAMQVALAKFETQLSDEQKSRFDTTDVTAAR